MFQIICTDNYAREERDERVVAKDITDEDEAKAMADELNAKSGEDGDDYYVVQPADYVPYVFEP